MERHDCCFKSRYAGACSDAVGQKKRVVELYADPRGQATAQSLSLHGHLQGANYQQQQIFSFDSSLVAGDGGAFFKPTRSGGQCCVRCAFQNAANRRTCMVCESRLPPPPPPHDPAAHPDLAAAAADGKKRNVQWNREHPDIKRRAVLAVIATGRTSKVSRESGIPVRSLRRYVAAERRRRREEAERRQEALARGSPSAHLELGRAGLGEPGRAPEEASDGGSPGGSPRAHGGAPTASWGPSDHQWPAFPPLLEGRGAPSSPCFETVGGAGGEAFGGGVVVFGADEAAWPGERTMCVQPVSLSRSCSLEDGPMGAHQVAELQELLVWGEGDEGMCLPMDFDEDEELAPPPPHSPARKRTWSESGNNPHDADRKRAR